MKLDELHEFGLNIRVAVNLIDDDGRNLLAHAASAHAVVAAENAVGHPTLFTHPIPGAVYTFPEIAGVGMTSQQGAAEGVPIRIGHFPIGHLGKAMAVGEDSGFVNVIRHRGDDSLLGVHMIGHNATEVIEAATAMLSTRASAHDLADMVFAHPTIGEAMKEAAENAFDQAMHLLPRQMVKMAAEAIAV